MQYLALVTDYDGTLANEGIVNSTTIDALRRLRQSGRKLVMVTGRELADLQRLFSHIELFDSVVAENGALIYDPSSKKVRLIAEAPPAEFIDELKRRGVEPLSVGYSIVATKEPHEKTVLDVIRDQGLELHVIFNKGSVMVLPTSINKATGLAAALEEMGLSPRNAVGIGDAENDHAFLNLCGFAVAVANALPAVKEKANFVTLGACGAGVCQLIELLMDDDLPRRER